MDDPQVLHRISTLADEERALHEQGHALDESQRLRLRHLEVALDQYWDYLRQRRAARGAGLDPESVAFRDPEVVEGYQQ
ncbi:MAG: DUF2630 family protein [Chloroflexi bacterium]|nr:DUF2630 family protein [Chloroflexota bacterium]